MIVWRTNWGGSNKMEPMHSVLEFQKQLSTSKGSSRKSLVDVPASEKMNFDWPDSLPIERIKAGLTEIALAFVFFAGLVTFGLASFFFLQRF
jgi:hypothetical protein